MEVDSRSEEEVVRWERFLPSVAPLRVLLVEPDDSTRHVISALIRSYNYKVKSVSDGLEAWIVLKEKPCSVDLILTEEDLPSISGFTLLTLVMEHDRCKKIPVIIMSSQDSISTVLKCMLKGAADFLIKPVRKSELKNLWQHVWRRHISNAGYEEEQSKIEAIPGKTVGSSRPSETKQEEVDGTEIKKVAKDQYSVEVRAKMDEKSDLSRAKFRLETLSNATSYSSKLRIVDECGIAVKTAKHNGKEDIEQSEHNRKEDSDAFEFQDRDDLFLELSPAAIDLIGKIGPCKHKYEISSPTVAPNDMACATQLELSLQRKTLSSSMNNERTEGRLLNHSHQSAFSRYSSGNRSVFPTPTSAIENSDLQGAVTALNESNRGHERYLQTTSHKMDDKSAMDSDLSEPAIIRSSGALVQLKGRLDSSDCDQALQTTAWSKNSLGKHRSKLQLSSSRSSMLQKAREDNMTPESSVNMHEREEMQNKKDHESSVHGSLLSSGLCTDVEDCHKNTCDRKMHTNAGNQSALATVSGLKKMDSLCSSQREAALVKFRLKRKERCFEKKVRYLSRKQLAEQRPRVKGQFVRPIHTEPQPSDADPQSTNA